MKRILLILSLFASIQLYSADTKNLEIKHGRDHLLNIPIEPLTEFNTIYDIVESWLLTIYNDPDVIIYKFDLTYGEDDATCIRCCRAQRVSDVFGLWDNPKIEVAIDIRKRKRLTINTLSIPSIVVIEMIDKDYIYALKTKIKDALTSKGFEFNPNSNIHFIFNGSEITDFTAVARVDGLWENPNVTITISR